MTLNRLTLLLVLLVLSTTAHAQRFNQKQAYDNLREGRWEASLLVGQFSGFDQAFENGAAIEVDDEFGWGFSFGWNWTDKWQFSWRFMMVKPDYTAQIVPEDPEIPPQTLDYTLTRYSNQLDVTYHFLSGPLTPFIQAGVGWTKLDSNVPSGPPVTGCWWDPWWGYICDTAWNTYDTSEVTYNVGLGVRWDVNGALFLRGTWNREFFSADRADFDFDSLTLEAGLMW